MSQLAFQTMSSYGSPRLQLLPKTGNRQRRQRHLELTSRPTQAAAESPTGAPRAILVAGGAPADREAVLRDLRESMPRSTVFEQAGALWEVVARASQSSMVVFSGELDEIPAESLMRLLANRHPELPVVTLDPPSPLGQARTNG
ncbi:MAG TPA: hypothetical protein VN672_01225 [Solirubrobacteraceae bacterium]|nr:hypothetical protein [Solirubrobacteraceae bacterium]